MKLTLEQDNAQARAIELALDNGTGCSSKVDSCKDGQVCGCSETSTLYMIW